MRRAPDPLLLVLALVAAVLVLVTFELWFGAVLLAAALGGLYLAAAL